MSEIKLCHDCGKHPPKTFVQLEGAYKLICAECSKRENRLAAVEQWVDPDEPKRSAPVIEAF